MLKLKKLLGDDFDILALIDPPMGYEELMFRYNEARSLLDGCYEIVELFEPKTPSQIEWKHKWLESARKHGASGV